MFNVNNENEGREGNGQGGRRIRPRLFPRIRNLVDRWEDRENNNNRRGQRERDWHHQQQQQHNNVDPHEVGDGGERILRLANLEELNDDIDEDGNTIEMRALKHVFNYHAVESGQCAGLIMIGGWLLLFLPTVSESRSVYAYGLLPFELFRHGIPLALVLASSLEIALKRDIVFYHPFLTFEMRILQFLTIFCMAWMLQFMLDILGTGLNFFHFDIRRKDKFTEQVNQIRERGFLDFLSLTTWGKVNTQLFIIGLSGLLIVDFIFSLRRMYGHSPVIAKILMYEFWAYTKPLACIVGYLLLLNETSLRLEPSKQTMFLWHVLFILLFILIVYVMYSMWNYPEIPLRRPIGIRGYLYMEFVTRFQTSLGFSTVIIIALASALYFQTVPGALMQSLDQPGLILGPPMFLEQIRTGIPPDKWTRKRLFEPSYDAFHGILFVMMIVRTLKHKVYSNNVLIRIDQLAHPHQHQNQHNNIRWFA